MRLLRQFGIHGVQVVAATEKTGDSESESEDSDGEKQGRGRFKSERPNIVSISKAKSRTDIPDTLGMSLTHNSGFVAYMCDMWGV